MKAKLKALLGSIEHWEANTELALAGGLPLLGADKCALCALYFQEYDLTQSCHGCPVMEATGESGCKGTPYSTVGMLVHQRKMGYHVPKGALVEACEEEVEFLRSLLPGVSHDD